MKTNYNFRDRTGERYGMLTALERDTDAVFPSGKLVRWKCRCDCGNVVTVTGSSLSKIKSCGCNMYGHNLHDLTGQKFGKLTVIERAASHELPCGQFQTMWKCRCDCGSIVDVRAICLTKGTTKSCGCLKSDTEKTAAEYLTSLNVHFKREYAFKDLISSCGRHLRFDFAIFDGEELKCLLELQGKQHYDHRAKDSYFGARQREETDQLKRDYCLAHNYPLYEIKYDEDLKSRIDNMLHDNTVPSPTSIGKV